MCVYSIPIHCVLFTLVKKKKKSASCDLHYVIDGVNGLATVWAVCYVFLTICEIIYVDLSIVTQCLYICIYRLQRYLLD